MTTPLQTLIAMPALKDSYFEKCTILLCEHSTSGAMGLVTNKLTHLNLGEILEQMDITVEDKSLFNVPILSGGPVHEDRGFVLHSPWGKWESSIIINKDIHLTSSKDILEEIAKGKSPDKYLVLLGYSGWAESQLEEELMDNSWMTIPAEPKLIFDTALHEKWDAAVKELGFDIHIISSSTGHA